MSEGFTVKITGQQHYFNELNRASRELRKAVNTGAKSAVEDFILPRVLAAAPHRTGRMKETIKVIGTARKVGVKAGSGSGKKGEDQGRYRPGGKSRAVRYAKAIHNGRRQTGSGRGHHAITPNPFIDRVIRENLPQVRQRIKVHIERAEREATRRLNALQGGIV